MLITEIISLAEAQCDEVLSKTGWLALINTCLDDLSLVAKNLVSVTGKTVDVREKTAEIVLSADEDLSKAHEILTVYYTPPGGSRSRLRKLPVRNMYARGWKLTTDKIILQGLGDEETGSLDLDIYQKLSSIEYDSEADKFTPDTPPAPLTSEYHPIIVSWLCAKSQQREEENEDKVDFMTEYQGGRQGFTIDRLKAMEPGRYHALSLQVQAQTQSE